MNAAEIITLLEDFDVVPHHVGRSDVKRAFSVVHHALAGVGGAQQHSQVLSEAIWGRTVA
jgi:hypothetical protein